MNTTYTLLQGSHSNDIIKNQDFCRTFSGPLNIKIQDLFLGVKYDLTYTHTHNSVRKTLHREMGDLLCRHLLIHISEVNVLL